MRQRSSRFHISLPEGHNSLEELDRLDASLPVETDFKGLVRRASSRYLEDEVKPKDEKSFVPVALASITLGVLSVVPYNLILQGDPGSPLFISFALHVVVVVQSLPKAHVYLFDRKIPLVYHASLTILSCFFTGLKSDAYVRLPAAVCMLLSNLRMLVGVLVQFVLFRKVYSRAQLVGVCLVTFGIAYAGNSMQSQNAAAQASAGKAPDTLNFAVGVLEIFGSSLALALMSVAVKLANSKHGESVEEQIFIQHLCALPLVFPSQWEKVGPRMTDWISKQDYWLIFNLVGSVLSTFAARKFAAITAGRSPNLLMTQLVQTLECFLQLLVTAFLRVPPWPPIGFWLGTLVLVAGTLQYLRASDSPAPDDPPSSPNEGEEEKKK